MPSSHSRESNRSNLLVIDDDPLVHHRFRRDFGGFDVTVRGAKTAAEGLAELAREPADVVMLDVKLPDMSGLDAYQRINEMDARVPVIFITAGSDSDTAIEAMKLGAYDYLLKPLDQTKVRELVLRAIEIRRLMQVPVSLVSAAGDDSDGDMLVGRCAGMQEVYKAIGRVAPQDVTVLIQGESGTGKELVARAIYQHSRRCSGPFLAINCAAIPESLLESELFGHEKGAFTGAEQQRVGKFEQCSGGTIFMDEIGDMTPSTQSKVLRLLQDQTFERIGGNETIRTDVRIIAATHCDLKQAVADGDFRGDLFYRLNVFTITLPPLRQRDGDLDLLTEHFLKRFGRDLGKRVGELSEEARRLLRLYAWPGNVRELQSVLKQGILHSTGPVLLADFLPDAVRQPAHERTDDGQWDEFIEQRLHGGSQNLYAEALELLERQLLTIVLRHTEGNQLRAAKILGMTRGTLRNKIRLLGITIDRVIADGIDEEPDRHPDGPQD